MAQTKTEKKNVINDFRNHVSSGKVTTCKKYGMEFVMGERTGAYMTDIRGNKRLINYHSN